MIDPWKDCSDGGLRVVKEFYEKEREKFINKAAYCEGMIEDLEKELLSRAGICYSCRNKEVECTCYPEDD